MKIIKNRLLPPGNFAAINLFGVLFMKEEVDATPQLINHELIHSLQMRELLYLPFYLIYVAEWIWRLFECGFDPLEAYRRLSFEREAYNHQSQPDYITTRPHFAQWRRKPE